MAVNTLPDTTAAKIAGYHITPSEHIASEIGQAQHRIKLLNFWQIPRGSKVLEIGCGQGTFTTVLAEAVGSEGHIDALDPGPPEYGAPYTLAQAQSYISNGPVGGRITWHNADLGVFLDKNTAKRWDFVVLGHCIWYFASPQILAKIFSSLRNRGAALLVAEYALRATEKAALPHLLASIARGHLETHNQNSEANIRCLVSPAQIKDIAQVNGWSLERENVIIPNEALLDGNWETSSVKSTDFLKEVETHVKDSVARSLLIALRDSVHGALDSLEGESVKTMDVWVARFN
jgi:SAM-dependent methyltransferase